ncbi:MAG: hypothetical protein M5U28_43705 [Sandaracinaceae bacterium]|nr:hypothetical protein [Sandaracinaceae bacterium]
MHASAWYRGSVGSAHDRVARPATTPGSPPVLLVHGIWDEGARFDRMRAPSRWPGAPARALDLSPNDGGGTIASLAGQVEQAAEELLGRSGAARLDLVGFSMGALVSRYFVQRARRQGARAALRLHQRPAPRHDDGVPRWARPACARCARRAPSSPRSTPTPIRGARSRCIGVDALHDLMIVPATSSQLPGAAQDHCLRIALHRWMITHPRAVERVVSILAR